MTPPQTATRASGLPAPAVYLHFPVQVRLQMYHFHLYEGPNWDIFPQGQIILHGLPAEPRALCSLSPTRAFCEGHTSSSLASEAAESAGLYGQSIQVFVSQSGPLQSLFPFWAPSLLPGVWTRTTFLCGICGFHNPKKSNRYCFLLFGVKGVRCSQYLFFTLEQISPSSS